MNVLHLTLKKKWFDQNNKQLAKDNSICCLYLAKELGFVIMYNIIK